MQAKQEDRHALLAKHGEGRADDPETPVERTVDEGRPHIYFNYALELCEKLREKWTISGVDPTEAIAVAWVVVVGERLKTLPKTWAGEAKMIRNYFTRDNPILPPKQWVSAMGNGDEVAQTVNERAASLWLHIFSGYTKNLS